MRKKLFGFIITGIIMLSLCACSLEYTYSNGKTVDGVYYVFSDARKICFASHYSWDEKEKNITITIQDEVDGYKVVALGGFIGSGVPTPFGVYTQNPIMGGDVRCIRKGTAVEEIGVTVRLGKNVKQIDCANMNHFLQTKEGTYIFIAKFEIDENNKYFETDETGRLTYSKYSPDYIDYFNYAKGE